MIRLADLPRHLVPDILLDIAERCGDLVAQKLWMYRGGVHVHVPTRPTPLAPLAEVLDMAELDRLCRHYAGEQLVIPLCEEAMRAVRNQAILADYEAGLDQWRIALKYGMHERQVNRIINPDKPRYNADLFDLLDPPPANDVLLPE